MLNELISRLRNTTKPKEKQDILKEYESDLFYRILTAAFDPFVKHHVKIASKSIPAPGNRSIDEKEMQDAFISLLDYCEQSNSNKQNRLATEELLTQLDEGSQALVIGTLNKNWKCGISDSTVNKAYPGLIATYKVQLSNKYLESIKKKGFIRKTRWCSYKLDGVRCTFLRFSDGWKAISRQGKEFLTVDHIKDDLEVLYNTHGYTFWDGELYVPGMVFEDIQGLVMRFTKGTSTELELRTFICGDKDSFFAQSNEGMRIVSYEDTDGAEKVLTHHQWLLEDKDVPAALEEAFELGYEGIMLRDPDNLYDYKRSDALLKLKESESDKSEEQTADCLVTGYTIDPITIIEDGKVITRELINRLIVQQKDGTECVVGSGFDMAFRYKYTDDPEELVGKVIEAKFQGYGAKGRMRFPRLFRIREDISWDE